METFIVLGVCILCYELCEFLYQCTGLDSGANDSADDTAGVTAEPADKNHEVATFSGSGPDSAAVIYTVENRCGFQ